MNQDDAEQFGRLHPDLHGALQKRLRPKALSADFRAQVQARLTASPLRAVHKLLRIELSLRLANVMALGLGAAVAAWAAWSRLAALLLEVTNVLGHSSTALIAGVAAAGILWLAARDPRMLS
jgi:hypothetical protein